MPSPDFDQLKTEILRELNDPNGKFWSKDEIADYLNEGQKEFVEETLCLTARAVITVKENQQIYTLPQDIIQIIRIEDKDGCEIKKSESNELNALFGCAFRDRTGSTATNPTHYYTDLVGQGRFEFYPQVSPSIEKSNLEFIEGMMAKIIHVTNASEVNEVVQSIDVDDTTLYVLTPENLYYYRILKDELVLDKTKAHNLTVSHTGAQSLRVIKFNTQLSSNQSTRPGVVYFADGSDLIQILPDGTLTTLASGVGNVLHILEFNYEKNIASDVTGIDNLYFQAANNSLYKVVINAAWASSVISLVNAEGNPIRQSTGNFINDSVYFSVSTVGLRKIDTSDDTLSTVTTNDIEGVAAIDDSSGTVYFSDLTDDLIKTLVPATDTITSTALAAAYGSSSVGFGSLISNYRDRVFWGDLTNLIYKEIINNVVTRKIDPEISHSISWADRLVKANKDFVFMANSIGTETHFIWVSSFERGVTINVDDLRFNQDEGALIDIIDDTDTINILGDEGSIEVVNINTEAAYVFYVYQPKQDIVQIEEFRALKEWVKYRAYEKRSDSNSERLSRTHFAKFNSLVSRELDKSARGFARSSTSSKSYFI